MNFNCPNVLVGQGRCWAAREEFCDGVLAVANGDISKLSPRGASVNARFWCSPRTQFPRARGRGRTSDTKSGESPPLRQLSYCFGNLRQLGVDGAALQPQFVIDGGSAADHG